MAITAIDTIVAHVMLVTELDRLLFFEELSRQVCRPCDLCVNVKRYSGKYNNHHHADPGYVVCTSIKELRHSVDLSLANKYLKSHQDPNLRNGGSQCDEW
jgi:hypothetical protein